MPNNSSQSGNHAPRLKTFTKPSNKNRSNITITTNNNRKKGEKKKEKLSPGLKRQTAQ